MKHTITIDRHGGPFIIVARENCTTTIKKRPTSTVDRCEIDLHDNVLDEVIVALKTMSMYAKIELDAHKNA